MRKERSYGLGALPSTVTNESIKTMEFMLAGVNMFLAQFGLILARAVRRGLK